MATVSISLVRETHRCMEWNVNPQPKKKTPRDVKYLKFVRSLSCQICGTTHDIQCHHTDTGGIALVGSDYSVVPLCLDHHREIHQKMSKKGPWSEEELHKITADLFLKYQGE